MINAQLIISLIQKQECALFVAPNFRIANFANLIDATTVLQTTMLNKMVPVIYAPKTISIAFNATRNRSVPNVSIQCIQIKEYAHPVYLLIPTAKSVSPLTYALTVLVITTLENLESVDIALILTMVVQPAPKLQKKSVVSLVNQIITTWMVTTAIFVCYLMLNAPDVQPVINVPNAPLLPTT